MGKRNQPINVGLVVSKFEFSIGLETCVWPVSANCHYGEGGNLVFYSAMRGQAFPESCSTYLANGHTEDGVYVVDPDGAGGLEPFDVYCDMTTADGGWTIVTSITGADGEEPLTGNVDALGGNPLNFEYYNMNQARKAALCSVSQESLFVMSQLLSTGLAPGPWIRTSAALFDDDLLVPNTVRISLVDLVASDGSTSRAYQGYANANNSRGGDFGIIGESGSYNAFDRHSSYHELLNRNCNNHYLYSRSAYQSDGDAGYGVNIGIGAWAASKWMSAAYVPSTGVRPWIGLDFGDHPQRINTLLMAQTGNAVSRIGLEWSNTGEHWVQCAEFIITDADRYSGHTQLMTTEDGANARDDVDECTLDNGGCDRAVQCVDVVSYDMYGHFCYPCPENYAGDSQRVLNASTGEWEGGCSTYCGDGVSGSDELCDDGNLDYGDGCNCGEVEFGYACNRLAEPSVCVNRLAKYEGCIELTETTLVHAFTEQGGHASGVFYVHESAQPEPEPEPPTAVEVTLEVLCSSYRQECTLDPAISFGTLVEYTTDRFGATVIVVYVYLGTVDVTTTCETLVDPICKFELHTALAVYETLEDTGETGV